MRYFFFFFFIWNYISMFFSFAFAINFSSYWDFSKTSETPLRKAQGYFFSFSKDLTSRMNFGGSINYSKTEIEDTWRENLFPSLYYSIFNDLFTYSLNYSYRINNLDTGENFSGSILSQNLTTTYKKFNINLYWNKNKNWSRGLK
ncbi:MAG: hypothetical protein DRP29_08510, partial [Thermodesulfobacteriota bacterium]